MAVRVTEYVYGEARSRRGGLRIGCTRYLPRGVKKENYAKQNLMDVWLPTLAPSRSLMDWTKQRDLEDIRNWKVFSDRYRREMMKTDARQVILLLGKIARRTPISVGCFCNSERCHAVILEKLVRKAAGKS